MPKPSAWIVDPPLRDAPRAAWEAFLEQAQAARKEHRTRAFDAAIKEARAVLKDGPFAGSDPARVEHYRARLRAALAPGGSS